MNYNKAPILLDMGWQSVWNFRLCQILGQQLDLAGQLGRKTYCYCILERSEPFLQPCHQVHVQYIALSGHLVIKCKVMLG